MMEAALPRSWKEQFAQAAAVREEDIKHREKLVRFDARLERPRRSPGPDAADPDAYFRGLSAWRAPDDYRHRDH